MSDEAKPEAPARVWLGIDCFMNSEQGVEIMEIKDWSTTGPVETERDISTAYIRADLADGLAKALELFKRSNGLTDLQIAYSAACKALAQYAAAKGDGNG